MSWMSMPAWQPPAYLAEPAAGAARGRLVEQSFESELVEGPHTVHPNVAVWVSEAGAHGPEGR